MVDSNSLWILKEGEGEEPKSVNEPLRCGDIIRLEHVNTAKNMHLNNINAHISGWKEVSGFGDNGNGNIDDNWRVFCPQRSNGDIVYG